MTTDICYFRAPWSYEKDLDTKICTDACACQMRLVLARCIMGCALWRAVFIITVLRSQRQVMRTEG